MTANSLIKGQNTPLVLDGAPVLSARVAVEWTAIEGLDVDVSVLLLPPPKLPAHDAASGEDQPEASDAGLSA